MKIIRAYILREILIPFFLSLFVLTCVFLLGNLIQLANLVVNKGVSLNVVGKVFLLYVPVLIGYTLPLACLTSVILTFSRFSADNEILALRANGIHLFRLLSPLLLLGIIISFASVLLNDRIIPYAHHEQRTLLKNLGVSNPAAMLEAGIFIKSFDNRRLFIHKIEGNRLYNVTVFEPQPNGPTRTIIAKRGEFTPVPGTSQIKLKLMDGTSDEPDLKEGGTFYKLNFDQFFLTLDFSKKQEKIEKKPKSMTLRELRAESDELDKLFIDSAPLKTEYHRKISWSFASLFFIILGFPLAVITHRRERSVNFVLAIVCAVIYYVVSIGCEALSIKSVLPPAFLMWIPNLLAFITAMYFNLKCAY
ncbi:MAG: LptF/LptG family permease [Candidatus Omnitrophica bacterium]|nr:LptF/LptG family permease [Candidatus Omnitrophota bacterium]